MSDRKTMKNIEEGEYTYLGILEADAVKDGEIKVKQRKNRSKETEYNKVKDKWKEYYSGHQFKSSFHCKIWSRNHKLDKDETARTRPENKKANDNVWDTVPLSRR